VKGDAHRKNRTKGGFLVQGLERAIVTEGAGARNQVRRSLGGPGPNRRINTGGKDREARSRHIIREETGLSSQSIIKGRGGEPSTKTTVDL